MQTLLLVGLAAAAPAAEPQPGWLHKLHGWLCHHAHHRLTGWCGTGEPPTQHPSLAILGLPKGCNLDVPPDGTTCITENADDSKGGCLVRVGPDKIPTKVSNSPQQGHVVLTNDGGAIAVTGNTRGCDTAAISTAFSPPAPPCNRDPDTGPWLLLWFGAVGVGNSNVETFQATLRNPVAPDYSSPDFQYEQWGVAAQPTAAPDNLLNKAGAYGSACDFQGNNNFSVYNSAIISKLHFLGSSGSTSSIDKLLINDVPDPTPLGSFVMAENLEIFGRTSFGYGSVLTRPGAVVFSLESRMKNLWYLHARVPGTRIASSLSFNQSAVTRVFDEAAAEGDIDPASQAYSVANSNEWKWVFVPYSKMSLATKPARLADIPRTFANVSRYDDVHIKLAGNAGWNTSLGFDDGMEVTGTLFDNALDLSYTALAADWGRPSVRNPVSDPRFPWRVCFADALLSYKRGSEATIDFDYSSNRGSFGMRFEGSSESDACDSGVCAPLIPTCTTRHWIEWCSFHDGMDGIDRMELEWCKSASEL